MNSASGGILSQQFAVCCSNLLEAKYVRYYLIPSKFIRTTWLDLVIIVKWIFKIQIVT